MLQFNTTIPTRTKAANADLGQVAIGSQVDLRLISTLDDGRTVRSDAAYGKVTISHQDSKEFGKDSVRHLIRQDLNANGTALPQSACHLVSAHVKGAQGIDRAVESFYALLAYIIGAEGHIDEIYPEAFATGDIKIGCLIGAEWVVVNHLITENLKKILNGEG